jgi:hypothetical protein
VDRSTFCMMGATTLCRNIYDSGLSSFREFLIMLIAQLYVKIDLLLTYGKHLNDRVISLERWCPTHIVLCLCFVFLRLMYSMLPVFLDCPFLIAPLVFSHVYLIPPHFIEVAVPSQESERSCIYMLVVSLWLCFYDFSIGLWNCFRQCGIFLFSIYYCHHYIRSVFINWAKDTRDKNYIYEHPVLRTSCVLTSAVSTRHSRSCTS